MIAPQTTRRYTGDLNTQQRAQLAALLADTTAGAAHYRPPVGRDDEVLRDLEHAGLSIFTVDCGYEITDEGRAMVAQLDRPDAEREQQARGLTDADLLAALRALPGALAELVDPAQHAEGLADYTAIRAEYGRRAAEAERRYAAAGPGRHSAEVFQPTEVFAAVERPGGGRRSGTLDLPVVAAVSDVVDDQDPAYVAQVLAAAMREPDAEPAVDELEVDPALLSDWTPAQVDRLTAEINTDTGIVGWFYRNATMPRIAVLCLTAGVLIGCGVMWLVAL